MRFRRLDRVRCFVIGAILAFTAHAAPASAATFFFGITSGYDGSTLVFSRSVSSTTSVYVFDQVPQGFAFVEARPDKVRSSALGYGQGKFESIGLAIGLEITNPLPVGQQGVLSLSVPLRYFTQAQSSLQGTLTVIDGVGAQLGQAKFQRQGGMFAFADAVLTVQSTVFGGQTLRYNLDAYTVAANDPSAPLYGYADAEFGAATISFAAVPEPGTWALMVTGTGALGVALRRRSRVRSV